ncbi:MAG: isoprenyl transferase [Candidatus Hydrogenedentota bacterium]
MSANFALQSTSLERPEMAGDLHCAIIMDGNGRWAEARGLPRTEGHRAGVRAVRTIVEAAPELGISMLTVYAFSSDNWRRPKDEVSALMKLLKLFLEKETRTCVQQGVRLQMIGKRSRLNPVLLRAIERSEAATQDGQRLTFRIAVDYSSRDAILAAARRVADSPPLSRGVFSDLMYEDEPLTHRGYDVDLLIRTGGEQRLSDFLLWECAYAELYFTPLMWPDFDEAALADAVIAYHRRQRRFGGLTTGSSVTLAQAGGQPA